MWLLLEVNTEAERTETLTCLSSMTLKQTSLVSTEIKAPLQYWTPGRVSCVPTAQTRSRTRGDPAVKTPASRPGVHRPAHTRTLPALYPLRGFAQAATSLRVTTDGLKRVNYTEESTGGDKCHASGTKSCSTSVYTFLPRLCAAVVSRLNHSSPCRTEEKLHHPG